MKQILGFVFIFSLAIINAYGQTNVDGKGFICGVEGQPSISLAKVTFFNSVDTTKVEFASVTDFEGRYWLGVIPSKMYHMMFSYPNYYSRSGKFEIHTSGQTFNFCFGEKQRKEGVNWSNKSTSYTISEAQKKSAKGIVDLLQYVPGVYVEGDCSSVTLAKGKVMLFVDGKLTKLDDINRLKPKKVESLDLYDISWSDPNPYTAVIDIVTTR